MHGHRFPVAGVLFIRSSGEGHASRAHVLACVSELPPAACEASSLSTSLSMIIGLDCSWPEGREVVSHCGFDLHFPLDRRGAFLHVLTGRLHILVGEMPLQDSCPRFNSFIYLFTLLSCNSSLFWIQDSYQIRDTQT